MRMATAGGANVPCGQLSPPVEQAWPHWPQIVPVSVEDDDAMVAVAVGDVDVALACR